MKVIVKLKFKVLTLLNFSYTRTMQDFYTVNEFAALMRVCPHTIRRAIKKGKILGFRVGQSPRSQIRIPHYEIERLALHDLKEIYDQILDADI